MRVLALLVLVAVVAAGCGPSSPTEAGGPDADPVYLLNVLPSPDDLRGPPVEQVDPGTLLETLTGEAADADLAKQLTDRGLKIAAVRTWTAPGGGELQAAVSVWHSHLVATGIGSDASARLADEDGGSAWTPSDVPGSRGARIQGAHPERRLAYAVGPNSFYVRSTGDVAEDAVIRTMHRLILTEEGQED